MRVHSYRALAKLVVGVACPRGDHEVLDAHVYNNSSTQ